MPRDLDSYMSAPDDFAGLSEADKAVLFAGGSLEGETVAVAAGEEPAAAGTESSEPPAAAAEPAAEPAEGAAEPEAVVLARDGKHTIPFEELAAARERATQLERENAELLAKLTQQEPPAAAAPPATPAKAEPAPVDLDALEAEAYEAGLEGDKDRVIELRRQINAENQRLARASIQAEQSAQVAESAAAEAQRLLGETASKAIASYPFLDINSAEKNDAAITDVRVWRDHLIAQGAAPHEALAKAVERFAPQYAPKPAGQSAAAPTAAEKAAQAIAAAKSGVPASLSDIPAGTAAHHDEAGAMLQLGSQDLMARFAGKTPEQIEALMAKVI